MGWVSWMPMYKQLQWHLNIIIDVICVVTWKQHMNKLQHTMLMNMPCLWWDIQYNNRHSAGHKQLIVDA